MLREQASKLLQQAKTRQLDIAQERNASNQAQTAVTDTQSNGSLKTHEARKNSLPTEFKTAPFTLVKKKQLKELSPRHYLKERKPSERSC